MVGGGIEASWQNFVTDLESPANKISEVEIYIFFTSQPLSSWIRCQLSHLLPIIFMSLCHLDNKVRENFPVL